MIDFPSNPTLNDLFTDNQGVEWICIDATVGDVQWARTGQATKSFIDLSDTPANYTGQANKAVSVKNDETGLEFIVPSSGGGFGKNYLINPTFIINQRNFAGGSLAASAFAYDRWQNGTASALTVNLSGATVTTDGNFSQKLEDMGYIGKMTVSWKGTSAITITSSDGGNFIVVAAASPYTFDYDGTQHAFIFGAGTILEPKLEQGISATPFEYPDVATELQKCERYYFELASLIEMFTISATGGNSILRDINIFYPTQMRIIPTVTYTVSLGTGSIPRISNRFVVLRSNVGNDSSFVTTNSTTIIDAEL